MDRPTLATGIPATSFVSLRLAAALNDAQYARVMEIPGAQPWWRRRTEVLAPYTAAALVATTLVEVGATIVSAYRPPCRWVDEGPLNQEQVTAAALAGGLAAWVLESFALFWQLRAATWITNARRGLLVAQPGAGKTLVGTIWMTALRAESEATALAPPLRVLYVCPTAAIRQVVREIQRFSSLPVIGCVAESSRRKHDLDPAEVAATPGPLVMVVGWESLVTFWSAVGRSAKVTAAIFDESDLAKNAKRAKFALNADGKTLDRTELTTRSAIAAEVARSVSAALLLTGTPVADSLRDLWGQLTLIEPNGWGQTDARFLVRYCDARPGAYGGLVVPQDARSPYLPELQQRLAWAVHEVTYEESHGHLPPKRRVMLRVPIEQQRAEVTGYARELNKTTDEAHKTFLRLALAASRKRSYAAATLPDYLKAGKGKMIVFTGLKKDADAWAAAFAKVEIRGVPLQTWASHGDASAAERDEVLQAYMAHPGPCVLCVTWQAWGVALNLDDTDVIVFAMLPFRPRDIAQAEGRGDRASMTRSLLYIYLIAEGTADEWVIDLILGKLEAVRAVSPGTRLDAFGGMRATLIGLDQADEQQKRMLARLEADIYADAE